MAEREYEIRITTRLDVDEASARKVRDAVSGIGRDIGGRLGEADKATRRLSDGIKILDANISPGRLIGWAIGWSSVYGALRLFTGGVKDAVASAFELDAALRNVNTIARMSEAGLSALRLQVVGLSIDASAGLRPTRELAAALYQIVSAGVPADKALEVLRAASTAAAAGLTTAENATTAIVSVLQAYGMSASHAQQVSDALFTTVQVGVPNFAQLSKEIGSTAATAALAGVPIEELGLAWGALSRVLVNASETSTSLSRVLVSFINPSVAMRQAVRQLGFDSAASMLSQQGLVESLRQLHTVTGDDATAIRALFPDIRAYRGAAVLLANDLAVLTQTEKDWAAAGGTAGATQKALSEIAKSQTHEIERLRRNWEALKLELGQGVAPALADTTSAMTRLLRLMREGQIQAFGRGMAGFRFVLPPEPVLIPRLRSEIERGEILGGIGRRGPQAGIPPAPLSLDELFRLFERHRALGEFNTAGQIRALSEVLIPRVEEELKGATDLAEIEKLETRLVQLEGQRVDLARGLADEFVRQAAAVERSFELVRRADVAAAEAGLRGIGQVLDLSIAPLEKFRELMGETFSPEQARRIREELQALQTQRIGAEIDTLRRLMETARTPEERVSFAGRLGDALTRRAQMQVQFLIENRQAESQRADALRKLIEQYDPTDPTRRTLEFQLQDLGRQKFTQEEIAKPYQDAAREIARIQSEVVNPALKQSQDEARKIAEEMLRRVTELEGGVVSAFGTIGKAAGRVFVAELTRELGDLAGNLTRNLIENLERELRNRKGGSIPGGSSMALPGPAASTGGGNVYVSVSGLDISTRLSESAKRELAEAVVGSMGDSAAAREFRLAGMSPVA